MKKTKRPIICFVVPHPATVRSFLLPHIKKLSNIGDVVIVTNANDASFLIDQGVNSIVKIIPIQRTIKPLADIKALLLLWIYFLKLGPSSVHTITPKCGFLGMLAAWLSRVPLRIHTFTGQVWVTRSGILKFVLLYSDKLTAFFSTNILVDGYPQRDFLIRKGVIRSGKSKVIANGSICGVNLSRFFPDSKEKKHTRTSLGLDYEDFVLLYVGRINKDKGLLDLASAFAIAGKNHPNIKLLIVGPDEENLWPDIMEICSSVKSQLLKVDYTFEPERYMRTADLFCLPSYREGFGSSVIEAQASGIPAIVSKIYGLQDSILGDETGWFYELGKYEELALIILAAFNNIDETKRMGINARNFVFKNFSEKIVVTGLNDFYRQILKIKID
jgi:glycosyltransferase involved in cell wall biosynthesis